MPPAVLPARYWACRLTAKARSRACSSGWRGRAWPASDFERITFYSDSTNDLPLLERVSHPVATNPAPALERIALERGWPILRLFA